MLVSDVMSVRLHVARLETPVKEIARVLVRNRIGGMPVVDDLGRLRGIVSESDLQPSEDGGRLRATATDVMTAPVITLTEEDSVAEAARILRRHRIKRAPVLREGRLVGIITQCDLLRPYLRTDGEIRADVEEAIWEDGVAQGARPEVTVHTGVVTIDGIARDRRQAALLARLAAGVDGVVGVDERMAIRETAGT